MRRLSDQKGQALVSYNARGKRWNVLAWGAINAIHPTTQRAQVKFKLDYSGGYGTYKLATQFPDLFKARNSGMKFAVAQSAAEMEATWLISPLSSTSVATSRMRLTIASAAMLVHGRGVFALAIPFLACFHYFRNKTRNFEILLEDEVADLTVAWFVDKEGN